METLAPFLNTADDVEAATSSTSQAQQGVYLDKKAKKRRGQPRNDILNVVRRTNGGKKAFRDLKYNDMLDLYKLWCGYYQEVLGLIGDRVSERLLKADYHGCLLYVTSAQNPSQIGLYGIVARESKHTFQLVTKQDRLIVIPKEGSTFQFVLDGRVFTLFGDAIKQQSYLRAKKAKNHLKLPFFLK